MGTLPNSRKAPAGRPGAGGSYHGQPVDARLRGSRHLDYYFDLNAWFDSNLKVMEEFPQVLVFPSWWVEYGMAIEPSVLGSKICFHPDQPPTQLPLLFRLEDIDRFPPINPHVDGLMSAALYGYGASRRAFEGQDTIFVWRRRAALYV